MPKKTVLVEMKMDEGFATECKAGNHNLRIDQPKAAGGTDTGPTPLEYFLLSFGGCIAAIARIVAKQKNILLRNVTIEVSGELNTDALMGRDGDIRAGFSKIDLRAELDADLSAEEKKAFLAEVDSRCPISDNIANPTSISVEFRK